MITKLKIFFLFLIGAIVSFFFLDFYLSRVYFKDKPLPNVEILDKKILDQKDLILKVVYADGERIFTAKDLDLRIDEEAVKKGMDEVRTRLSYFPLRLGLYFGLVKVNLRAKFVYNRRLLEELLQELEYKYNKPPKDARFVFSRGKVREFRKEEAGVAVDREAFWKDLEKTIYEFKNKKEVKLEVKTKTIQPKVKLADINSFGIEELIGMGKSSYKGSIWQRVHNIILATERISGTIVPVNGIFSFNKTLGDVSIATGYKQSYIIKDGKTVLGDGGGVCQVSTTLFRAVLNSGLPIIERHAHSYRVSYYENDSPPGFDATVFAPTVDFKFKNDTPAYLLIQGEVNREKKEVYFFIYGKNDGRKVFLTKPKVYDIVPPPEPLYVEDPTLKKGVIKQIDFAAWGAKAYFDYKVERGGKVLFKKRFFSNYKPWQAVYLVGVGE